jgi:hypothetical protein
MLHVGGHAGSAVTGSFRGEVPGFFRLLLYLTSACIAQQASVTCGAGTLARRVETSVCGSVPDFSTLAPRRNEVLGGVPTRHTLAPAPRRH